MNGPYSVIVSDPPWHEPGGCNRGANDRYDTLDRTNILRVMLAAPCWNLAKDCHHWMWTTMTSLVDSLWLMDALGFEYKTHGVWVKSEGVVDQLGDLKLTIGLGQYLRGTHELFLLGTRGRGFAVRTEVMNISSTIIAPVPRIPGGKKRLHSGKPEKFYRMVEARSAGPKIEMFARQRREGWDGWGNDYPEASPP